MRRIIVNGGCSFAMSKQARGCGMREIAGARLACALALWLLASSAGGCCCGRRVCRRFRSDSSKHPARWAVFRFGDGGIVLISDLYIHPQTPQSCQWSLGGVGGGVYHRRIRWQGPYAPPQALDASLSTSARQGWRIPRYRCPMRVPMST